MPPHKPHLSLSLLLPLLAFTPPTNANTEKVIFTAPPPIPASTIDTLSSSAGLSHRNLPVLGPSTSWSVRTNLSRVFPLDSSGEKEDGRGGFPSWLVLEDLTPGQRYELRVCWSALEPTEFTLDIYPLSTVLSTPQLLQSLSQHATSFSTLDQQIQPRQHHHHHHHHLEQPQRDQPSPNETSILLLRVLAAADYFSHHPSLMKDPPPVLVDLILDPYIYNLLPQSLVPTVCYLVVVAVASWFVARWAAKSLTAIAGSDDDEKKQN
ncbi:hypothetical protein J3F83DRAFT_750657 [Trichoderma novae-zelandiae]